MEETGIYWAGRVGGACSSVVECLPAACVFDLHHPPLYPHVGRMWERREREMV